MSRASDRAYAEIRGLILSGDAPPGAQLKEEQLAEICGVSRTPVRDALRRLEAELYVVRSDSKRAFVAEWSSEDLSEMFTLRSMLEGHAAARAARRFTAEGMTALRVCNARIEQAVLSDEQDIADFLEHNREFHRLIVETAQSKYLESSLAMLVEQPIVRRTAMHYGPDQLVQSVREHQELIQAFTERDPDWARAVMTAHIRRAFHAFAKTAARVGDESSIG
ncbi:GntR family transcriptional regulator [Sphingomonas sp.]|uniref:GntR family transcriptional regulator n=1 Tax=Sphingomonas sp. TaxID=28214 RepID=UPI00325FA0C0